MYVYVCKFLIFLFIHKLNDNNFVYILRMLANVAKCFQKIRKYVMGYSLFNFNFQICEKFGTNTHWMQLSTKIEYHNTLAALTHVY
jgi:hypothetical protein